MMRRTPIFLIAVLALVLGCAGPTSEQEAAPANTTAESATAEKAEDIVAKAAVIAKEIEADPGSAETILAGHDMTIDDFDQLMYEISADPDLSEAYAAALAE